MSVWQVYEQERRAEREELIKAIAEVPVSESVLKRFVSRGDAEELLRYHPGYETVNIISSLWNLLEVFRHAWRDLLQHLDRFNAFAQDDASEYRSGEETISEIEGDVRKEVFCISCAAKSLVEMSRSLKNKVTVPGYRERIKRDFADDPEHNFVMGLRRLVNHIYVPTADWMISFSFDTQEAGGEFALSCKELLHNGQFNKLAKDYILSRGDKISVRSLFSSYADRVEGLYGWLVPQIEENLPVQVADYRRCRQAWERNCALCWWRVILGQIAIPNKIDPYLYLHRYLTEEQLKEVLAMQHGSRTQVDRIIELVDEEGVCDGEIRQLVYQLFNISS